MTKKYLVKRREMLDYSDSDSRVFRLEPYSVRSGNIV